MARAGEIAVRNGREVLREQGHRASGRLERSFEARLRFQGTMMMAEILVEAYGVELNFKRPGFDFPSPDMGGIFRDFVEDLVEWIGYTDPGLPSQEKREKAHRVARALHREGSPTRGAKRFSKTGRRTGWIEEAMDKAEEDIARMIEDGPFMEVFLDSEIVRAFKGLR